MQVIHCERCGQSTPTPVRLVTQTRPKTYKPRPRANVFRRLVKERIQQFVRDDPGGEGWEIVHEAAFCPRCAEAIGTSDLIPGSRHPPGGRSAAR